MTRQNYYAESLTESTTTSSTYQDKVSLVFTPDDNSTYMIFFSCLSQSPTGGISQRTRLQNTTSATTLNECPVFAKDPTDYWCVSGIAVEAFGASPAEQTYKVQFASGTNTVSVSIKEAHIVAIKLGANDFSAVGDGPHVVTDTNYVTGVTMTQTFQNGKDYYVFASAEITTTSATPTNEINALYDGGTAYGGMIHDFLSTSNAIPWCNVFKITGDGTSNPLIIRSRSSSTTDVGFRKCRLVAFLAEDFTASFYDEQRTRQSGTEATFQDVLTGTHTPAAAEHLVFGGGIVDGSSTTVSSSMQFIEGATSLGEHIHESSTGGTGGGAMAYAMGYQKTLAASSTTWKTQRKSETTSATTGIDENFILILQTGDAAAVNLVAGPMQDLNGQFTANYGGQGFIDPTIHKIDSGI